MHPLRKAKCKIPVSLENYLQSPSVLSLIATIVFIVHWNNKKSLPPILFVIQVVGGDSSFTWLLLNLLWNVLFSPVLEDFGKVYGDCWLIACISQFTEKANLFPYLIIAASIVFLHYCSANVMAEQCPPPVYFYCLKEKYRRKVHFRNALSGSVFHLSLIFCIFDSFFFPPGDHWECLYISVMYF